MALDPLALLTAYDQQLRTYLPTPLPETMQVQHDGPLIRVLSQGEPGFLTYVNLNGLTGPELDTLIAGQRDFFAARGEAVEWKWHSHDQPADLPDRLRAHGFEPEPAETVVVGLAAPLATATPPLPDGVRLREV